MCRGSVAPPLGSLTPLCSLCVEERETESVFRGRVAPEPPEKPLSSRGFQIGEPIW